MRSPEERSAAESPEARTDEDGRAVRAAVAYYVEKKTMDAVARELETSRATVSRLLASAREDGIVEIKVFQPGARASRLAERLTSSYGVRPLVVPVAEEAPVEEKHARTAEAAARLLRTVVTSDVVLAVAWGTMVNAISTRLRPKAVTNCRVVQVNGMGNGTAVGVHYAHGMMDRFGHAFGANVLQRPLPLFFDTPGLAGALGRDRLVLQTTQLIQNADVFLFNVGTVSGGLPSAPHLYGNFLEDTDFRVLQEDGAVGDIATSFFDGAGECAPVRLNARTSGPDLEALRSIPRRICAVSGIHKIGALHAALLGGHISDLVIDEQTADALIDAFPAGLSP
ncbi:MULTISPECIES: sugar-binding transcriptional regulator [Brachybacterium]|uniref:sugar-binding transcriptional regulator n=1 Tax=Brachybacterium TaxID=43668 RepID=UPI001314F8FA|nr:sugar-binding domain-containing protein [Brachybacterium sp. JB7]